MELIGAFDGTVPVHTNVFFSLAFSAKVLSVPFQVQESPSKTTFAVQLPSEFPVFWNVMETVNESPRFF